ncbi:hypothetical protein QUF94_05995 [Peribacillus sp. NJ4]|uniref:hypothetical protein n=1 Tax=Peribacillus TaxID=2675229 RepID=UPI0025A17B22|nr:hypothetical protein [Peribacillus sp. NJ4]MDM5210986.1 hypothetical protein [Peribacillus sp. NJ4]
MKTKLVCEKVMQFTSKDDCISTEIAANGDLLLLEMPNQPERMDGFVQVAMKQNLKVHIINNQQYKQIEFHKVPISADHVQTFSDGTIMLVGSRCEYNEGKPDKNARFYDNNGQFLYALTFGDGIQSVQVDEQDRIWISYFDEGVFGNYGWDEPIGRHGLILFDRQGNILWHAGEFGISDCYALNVASSDKVCFYYYHDFKFVILDELFQPTFFNIKKESFWEFAISDDAIAIFDGNGSYMFHRKGQTFKKGRRIQYVDEQCQKISGRLSMRAEIIYIYNNDGIYKTTLSQNNK